MRKLIYDKLSIILPGKVFFGYYDSTKIARPTIAFSLMNIGRDYDTENFYNKGQVSIVVVTKTKSQNETIADSIKALDCTKLGDAKLVKFMLAFEVPTEVTGGYLTQIVFDYWREE